MESDPSSLANDFYVNQKIGLTLDLPGSRESVLDMFDRLRREFPRLGRVRRQESEVSLETEPSRLPNGDRGAGWVALKPTSVRSGCVNPERLEDAYAMHRRILEIAPFYLSISPLDIDHVELVFGFDFETDENRDEIVFDALYAGTPLADLVDPQQDGVLDAQPFLGITLSERGDFQAFFEVKSRPRSGDAVLAGSDPISIYLTVRRNGPIRDLAELPTIFASLCGHAERLAETRVIPSLIVPIRNAILSRP